MKNKTFTLIELIVVIAIIAILAAIIAPNAFKAIEKARKSKTIADLKAIKTAIAALYADTGKVIRGCPPFVTVDGELYINDPESGLISKPSNLTNYYGCQWTQGNIDAWDGPYLEGAGSDVWKRAYLFDGDYMFCDQPGCGGVVPCGGNVYTNSACNGSSAREVCVAEGGSISNPISPPVLGSLGPDGNFYTCDDIIIKMTLN